MSLYQPLTFDEYEAAQITDIVTSDGTASGTPVPITGWAMKFVVHADPGDDATKWTGTTAGGQVVIPTGTDGRSVTTIPNSAIKTTLGPGQWNYYLARTDAGAEAVVSRGSFTIRGV